MDEQPGAGLADLTLVPEDAHGGSLQRAIPLGIGEDDVGGLAAQFERRGDELFGGGFRHNPTDAGRAGEGQLGDLRMVEDRLPGHGTSARDNVDHAGRQHLGEDLGEFEDRDRRHLGRLDDHRVARRDRRRDLPGRHQQREVPGNDLPDDADRFVDRQTHRLLIDHRHFVRMAADHAGEIAEMVDRERHVEPGFADGLADIHALENDEAFGIGLEQIGDLEERIRSIGHRGLAPGLEGAGSGLDGAIDIGGRAVRGARQIGTIGGIDTLDRLAIFAIDPLVVDEMTIAIIGSVGRCGFV